jgi:DNA polymerase III subunit chi
LTEILFHFNVPEKMDYACRLLRKAVANGAKVVVAGEQQELARLDTALWTFSPLDFVGHCFHGSNATLLAASPVILGCPTASDGRTKTAQVLLNLGIEISPGFEQYEKLIELVGESEDDRQSARLRWKHYANRGYAISRHDVAGKTTP